jgi:hypothetical protein
LGVTETGLMGAIAPLVTVLRVAGCGRCRGRARFGAASGEGDAHAGGGLGDARGNLDQACPQRGELGLGERLGIWNSEVAGFVKTAFRLR